MERGKAKEVAKIILERNKSNAISSSTRINDVNNVITEIIYNTSSELYNILEQVKKIPYVSSATWSELVEVVGNNDAPIIAAIIKTEKIMKSLHQHQLLSLILSYFYDHQILHNRISLVSWTKV